VTRGKWGLLTTVTQRDGFAGESLHEDLQAKATTQTQHQMKGGFVSKDVVADAAVLELLRQAKMRRW
jgi:hypothetical protein